MLSYVDLNQGYRIHRSTLAHDKIPSGSDTFKRHSRLYWNHTKWIQRKDTKYLKLWHAPRSTDTCMQIWLPWHKFLGLERLAKNNYKCWNVYYFCFVHDFWKKCQGQNHNSWKDSPTEQHANGRTFFLSTFSVAFSRPRIWPMALPVCVQLSFPPSNIEAQSWTCCCKKLLIMTNSKEIMCLRMQQTVVLNSAN